MHCALPPERQLRGLDLTVRRGDGLMEEERKEGGSGGKKNIELQCDGYRVRMHSPGVHCIYDVMY